LPGAKPAFTKKRRRQQAPLQTSKTAALPQYLLLRRRRANASPAAAIPPNPTIPGSGTPLMNASLCCGQPPQMAAGVSKLMSRNHAINRLWVINRLIINENNLDPGRPWKSWKPAL
jgi:hypothetical protein